MLYYMQYSKLSLVMFNIMFTPSYLEINPFIVAISIFTLIVKTVLLECFIKVIEYDECSIRVYRSFNIFVQAFYPAIYCTYPGAISWSLLGACS